MVLYESYAAPFMFHMFMLSIFLIFHYVHCFLYLTNMYVPYRPSARKTY
jgi:hypothetical protein